MTDIDIMAHEIVCASAVGLEAIPVAHYPDGMPLMRAPLSPPTALLLRPRSLDTFFAALAWVDALAARGHAVPRLLLPCVPGARQDRLNPSGDYLDTLYSIAQAINARHFPSVTVLDPHSLVTPALIDRCHIVYASLPFVAKHDYLGVIAPDGGAEKRAGAVAQVLGVPLFHAWKRRDVATGALSGFACEPLEPGGYLVVDDLCDGGGTFVGLAETIGGRARLDLFVTHGLFTKGTDELLRHFHRIYTTDSTLHDKPGVRVIPSCASLLRELL